MNTANYHGVGVRASMIVFPTGIPMTMNKDDALLFAAWIVALADHEDKFEKILDEVQGI